MDEHRSEGSPGGWPPDPGGLGRELTCEELVEFLDDYVEGKLPLARRAVFERHLETCADCRNYLVSYRETIRISAAALEELPVSEALPEELIRAILESRKG